MTNPTANAGLIWAIAELLRGDYKQSDYGKVVLPFTLLRRLDCVLAPSRKAVQEEYARRKDAGFDIGFFLTRAAGLSFYNTSSTSIPRRARWKRSMPTSSAWGPRSVSC